MVNSTVVTEQNFIQNRGSSIAEITKSTANVILIVMRISRVSDDITF